MISIFSRVVGALLLWSSWTAGNDNFLLVVSVARHGARSPQAIMPFNKTNEQFKNTSELLATGFNQQREIGRNLRKRYIEQAQLLSDKYNSAEVYAQATDKMRT
jgi:acid phosphatase